MLGARKRQRGHNTGSRCEGKREAVDELHYYTRKEKVMSAGGGKHKADTGTSQASRAAGTTRVRPKSTTMTAVATATTTTENSGTASSETRKGKENVNCRTGKKRYIRKRVCPPWFGLHITVG